MEDNKTFNSKILLFGEYSVLLGSNALAIPYDRYNGRLAFASETKNSNSKYESSNNELQKLFLFLSLNNEQLYYKPDIRKFENDLKKGLYFESSIPQNYGLGSSGAVCAAVYSRYFNIPDININNMEIHKIHRDLKKIESFFHGSSSGIDPVCSLLDRPVYIAHNEISEIDYVNKNSFDLFLLDTLQNRSSHNLIEQFKQQWENQEFIFQMMHDYIPLVNNCITSFISNNKKDLDEQIFEISYYQFKYFTEIIPVNSLLFWEYGLQNQMFTLKLCGAGDGGFLLGFTQSIIDVISYFNNHNIPVLRVM